MWKTEKSEAAFKAAQKILPGGVNSPVRAFRSVGRNPLFIDHGKGAYLFDVDGNRYIDYVLSWGPMILGHGQEQVVAAIKQTAEKGTSFGAPSPLETQLAELIQKQVPSMELMRMVSSGTEATMSAIRLARGVTKRDKIIKFDGCYHGHSDSFLVNAGSGVATFELTDSPGVPTALAKETLSVPYNDLAAVKDIFTRNKQEIAAVIVEPIAGNMGVIPGNKEFLQGLRTLTKEAGALLIFDEVMTGFRCNYTGAQGLYEITPDLTTLGKVVGGGLPAAVFGGKREYMKQIAPEGAIYQAGTLSGNPLAMAAGIATLQQLNAAKYQKMTAHVERLLNGIKQLSIELEIPIQTVQSGTMFGFFFNKQAVTNFEQAKASDQVLFAKFYRNLLAEGIYIAPSQFEANFISTMHTEAEIDWTIKGFRNALIKATKEVK